MENETKIITAEMASQLTVKNLITIERICNTVQNVAESGMSNTVFINTAFPSELIKKVLDLGYEITQGKNPFGDQFTKISW